MNPNGDNPVRSAAGAASTNAGPMTVSAMPKKNARRLFSISTAEPFSANTATATTISVQA